MASAGNDGVDDPSHPAARYDVCRRAGATNASNPRRVLVELGRLVDIVGARRSLVEHRNANHPYDDLTWWYFETYCGFDGAHRG